MGFDRVHASVDVLSINRSFNILIERSLEMIIISVPRRSVRTEALVVYAFRWSFLPQVKQLLKEGGAMRGYYMDPLITHVIIDEPLSDGTVSLVKEASVPVLHVREEGYVLDVVCRSV